MMLRGDEEMMPKVSVVVPVYNSEKYLAECVDSILNQTLGDLECILVDDGSTDSSGKICDMYAEKDPRVKVIHQKNARIGAARNAGIDVATGKYVTFVDSDDRLELNAYEEAVSLLETHAADVIQWDVQYFYSKKYETNEVNKPFWGKDIVLVGDSIETAQYLYDLKSLQKEFNNIGLSTHCVWTKMCSKKLFDEGIRFPTDKEFEDEFMTTKIYMKAKKFITVNKRFSNYRLRPSSTIHTMPVKGSYNRAEAAEERLKFILSTGNQKLISLAVSDFVVTIVSFYQLAFEKKEADYAKKILRMSELLKGKESYIDSKRKIAYIVFKISPRCMCVALKLYQFLKTILHK